MSRLTELINLVQPGGFFLIKLLERLFLGRIYLIAGKVLAIFFPIMAFVALGYEHIVANMYFVPMGLFLKGTSAAAGVETSSLGWGRFLTANVVPVTLGNIIGGAAFVGAVYWWVYVRREKTSASAARQR